MEQEEDETLSDGVPYLDSKTIFMHAHGPWLFASIAGFFGFYYVYKQDMNGIVFLPVFIYFNGIHIAKSYLSYNKTMILTLLCLFPTVVAVICVVPQFNVDIMNILTNIYLLCYLGSTMIAGVYYKFRIEELSIRLWDDEDSEELNYNKNNFTQSCFCCLIVANFTALLLGGCYLFGYILPDQFVPHIERPPAGLVCKSIFSFVVFVFGIVTLKYAKKTVCYFMKVRSLKKEVKDSEVHL
uniref:YrhK domain-containing protein n=1 Tax=Panagrellus redivivus TaxID=6233 RepID=A0A7E4V1D7_PANRE